MHFSVLFYQCSFLNIKYLKNEKSMLIVICSKLFQKRIRSFGFKIEILE